MLYLYFIISSTFTWQKIPFLALIVNCKKIVASAQQTRHQADNCICGLQLQDKDKVRGAPIEKVRQDTPAWIV